MKNDDPFAVWNDPMHKDDPFAPHNNPMDRDNPFKPWNDPFGSERDLSSRERHEYGLPDQKRRDYREEMED